MTRSSGGDPDGGLDTARVSAAEQQYRDAQRATARKNLAAMACTRYGIDPTQPANHWHRVGQAARYFAELAEMLGLDQAPEREPGTCRQCGGAMALNRQVRRDSRVNGLCDSCNKGTTIACRRDGT